MSIELWLVFVLAASALSLTPGPNGLLCLDHGVRYGARRTAFTALGSVAGMTVLIGGSLAGLGAVMMASEELFTLVKWLGAAYLVWLGLRLWRAPPFSARPEAGPETGTDASIPYGSAPPLNTGRAPRSGARLFMQGFLVALSNPKALIFFATFLPQFMQPALPIWQQFVIFSATFAVIEFFYEVMLAGAAGRLAPLLESWGRVFNRITGGVFMGVGAMVALSDR